MRGARILGVIHAMTEAGNLLLARELRAHDFLGFLDRRVLPDVEQHLHHFRIRAAVQRTFERPNASNNGRVNVRQRRGNHTRGKCGRIQLVVRMKNQRDVEGLRGQAAGPVAGEHVEEVRRVTEHRIWRNRTSSPVHSAHRRDERARLRREPYRLAVVRLG